MRNVPMLFMLVVSILFLAADPNALDARTTTTLLNSMAAYNQGQHRAELESQCNSGNSAACLSAETYNQQLQQEQQTRELQKLQRENRQIQAEGLRLQRQALEEQRRQNQLLEQQQRQSQGSIYNQLLQSR